MVILSTGQYMGLMVKNLRHPLIFAQVSIFLWICLKTLIGLFRSLVVFVVLTMKVGPEIEDIHPPHHPTVSIQDVHLHAVSGSVWLIEFFVLHFLCLPIRMAYDQKQC